MRVISGNRVETSIAEAGVGIPCWATEFERVYLMTAARIRGEPMYLRQRANITRPIFVRGR